MFCGKAFNAVTRRLFHDSNSKRGGVLMHAKVSCDSRVAASAGSRKVLIALFEPRPDTLGISGGSSSNGKRKADEMAGENEDVGGWVYVGSHNFSGAAWVSGHDAVGSVLTSGNAEYEEDRARAECAKLRDWYRLSPA